MTQAQKERIADKIWDLQHQIDRHMARLWEADELFADCLNAQIADRTGV